MARPESKKATPALIDLEVMSDHIHLLVEVDPQFGIHKLVKLA
jgi:REP element-mobilizing transposase RayT